MTNQREREEKGGGRGADARRWDLGVGSLARSSRSRRRRRRRSSRSRRRQDTGGGKEGWHRSTLRCFKHCRKSAPFLIRTFFMIGLAGMRIAKGFVG